MWMDLWEKERLKYEETYAAFKWQEDFIRKQQATLDFCNTMKENSEKINEELLKRLSKEHKKRLRLGKAIYVGIPVAFIVGGTLGILATK